MSPVTTTKLSDADVAAIRQMCDVWDEVGPTRDWDRAAATVSEDFVFLFPEQPPIIGRSAWKQWVESFPPIQQSKINLEGGTTWLSFAERSPLRSRRMVRQSRIPPVGLPSCGSSPMDPGCSHRRP